MPWWHWIFWTFWAVFSIFLWLPEIKSIFIGKRGAGMERFEKKLDKALVEYDEFRQTIYPLLEASLAQIISVRYVEMPPKSSVMIDYVPRITKVLDKGGFDLMEARELLEAVKSMTLYGIGVELGIIASKYGVKQTDVENCISSGLEDDYSKTQYVNTDEIGIDFDKLEEYSTGISNIVDRQRYEKKLDELRKFYAKYY